MHTTFVNGQITIYLNCEKRVEHMRRQRSMWLSLLQIRKELDQGVREYHLQYSFTPYEIGPVNDAPVACE